MHTQSAGFALNLLILHNPLGVIFAKELFVIHSKEEIV